MNATTAHPGTRLPGRRPCFPCVRRLVEQGVRERVYPGAVWAVGDASGTHASGTAGTLTGDPAGPPTLPGTAFDVASFTKVFATWSSVGALWEAGLLDPYAPLGTYWPAVAGRPVGGLTAHQLLTHTAGLPLRAQLKPLYGSDPAAVRRGVLSAALRRPPGEAVEYTDRAAIILGFLVEDLTGRPLGVCAEEGTFLPLGMGSTRYGPLPFARRTRCAPTELDPETGRHAWGTVHDYSARVLGSSCGSAGLFSTADDVAAFLRHVLGGTPGTAPAGFGPRWVTESLRVHTGALRPVRGLLWHLAPGTAPAADVWAHYGFTGTGMWVCPRKGRWALLLTNKLHFGRERGPMTGVRDRFRELAFA
ncbi:serine hydrolase domain-containing protein [Streptomyces sp. NPDC001941]|uniref:serine hydrolase domain-containing protein n=1 Tax=Streptomyces sp. NPDC001941 TaxID=3154659 RepID=UPI00332957A1